MKVDSRCAALVLAVAVAGCAARGDTGTEKRAAIVDMRDEVLAELYSEKPDTRSQLASAPGYGVFSNANVNIILASFGGGYGVVEDNRSGGRTWMKMGEVGIGLGAGVKDYRLVFVFHSDKSLDYFLEHGWAFGGQADAAAKAGDKGGAVGGELMANDVTIYQLTEAGLALQATVKGTRYWVDGSLN